MDSRHPLDVLLLDPTFIKTCRNHPYTEMRCLPSQLILDIECIVSKIDNIFYQISMIKNEMSELKDDGEICGCMDEMRALMDKRYALQENLKSYEMCYENLISAFEFIDQEGNEKARSFLISLVQNVRSTTTCI